MAKITIIRALKKLWNATTELLAGKQDTLTAGQNIVITNNTISAVIDAGFNVEVAQTLPTTGETNTIYFVSKEGGENPDVYDEYMYINNAWEKIGNTSVDLSNYFNKDETDYLLSTKQGVLTAGANIIITGNTIAARGYNYNRTTGSFTDGDRDIFDSGTTRPKPSATGVMAHAEGINTKAIGRSSHAEGNGGSATGVQSHAEGSEGNAIGINSHVEGRQAVANGYASHAEGVGTETGGNYGSSTSNPKTADSRTNAGDCAHAEGLATIAYGVAAHSEGKLTLAKGERSHAEGENTVATGINAHAENYAQLAEGNNSHAEGRRTKTLCNSEHAQGSFNVSHRVSTVFDGNVGNTLHSIGIGTADNARKNAVEVMQSGQVYLIGVGNYDGIHIKGETGAPSGLQTLQEVVNRLRTDLENGLKECQKTVYPYARFDDVTGEVTGDYPDGGEYYYDADLSYFECNYIGAYNGNGGRVVCVRPWRITELITNDNLGVPIELLFVDPMYNSVDEWYANREYIIRVVCDGADGNLSVPSSIRWATPQIPRDLADHLGISIDDYAYMPPLRDGHTYDIHILNGVAWWVETPNA